MKVDYSLTERPGYLRLHGGPYNLSVPTCPTLFLRRLTHRVCTWETRLSFSPSSPHTEAGTVVWWNYFTYSSIGISLSAWGGPRVVRWRSADGQCTDLQLSSATSEVIFVIKCGDRYKFGYREVDEPTDTVRWIGEAKNTDFTNASLPVGAPFTGMMLGLYSFGERQRCLVPADFSYAEFKESV